MSRVPSWPLGPWHRLPRTTVARHRVIRVDLLGFGASSKPKRGYTMEHQARLVLLTMPFRYNGRQHLKTDKAYARARKAASGA